MLGLSCGTQDLSLQCMALCCGAWASLYLWSVGFLFSSYGEQAPGRVGSVLCGTWVLLEAHKLSSYGVQAELPPSMWDLSSLTRD